MVRRSFWKKYRDGVFGFVAGGAGAGKIAMGGKKKEHPFLQEGTFEADDCSNHCLWVI
jgi:hypothetical protein